MDRSEFRDRLNSWLRKFEVKTPVIPACALGSTVDAVRGVSAYAARRSILFWRRCPGHIEVGDGNTRMLRVKEPLAADGDPIQRGSDLRALDD